MGEVLKVPFRGQQLVYFAHKAGVSIDEIASAYGTSEAVIAAIVRRETKKFTMKMLAPSRNPA